MARGRMISKSLSTSERRLALHRVAGKLAEFCQALYPLMVAHADDWGRLPGEEQTVKLLIDPGSPRKVSDFVAALHALHAVGLICWYRDPTNGGRKVIEIEGFADHQTLHGHDARPPKFTACASADHWIGQRGQVWAELGGNGLLREEKRTEEKRTEPNHTALRARFERFWAAYPKKTGKDAAWKAFHKRQPGDDLTEAILTALAWQTLQPNWTKDGGQYIPNPATWLNQGRWADEPQQGGPLVSARTHQLAQATKDFLRS